MTLKAAAIVLLRQVHIVETQSWCSGWAFLSRMVSQKIGRSVVQAYTFTVEPRYNDLR